MAGALALAATSGWAPPAAGSPPVHLLIIYGAEFATYRTPVFLRTLLSTRTVPLRLHVLADGPGHAGFERAVEEHARPLMWPEDHIRALRVAGRLDRYCELAEQDTLNYMLAQRPDLWRPLDCSWNYMATERGGHRLVTDPHLVASFYDESVSYTHLTLPTKA